MAQQGHNDNTYDFDELAFWRPIDAENRPVYRAVLRESRAIQDEAQDILNRFAGLSMMGLLPKAQMERLHRDIARWKKQGESTGELRLLMQDAQRRTKMRCDEAMLLYLMHVISDSYARISEVDRDALLSATRIAYKRAFAEGNEITRLGAKNAPGAKFVGDTLSNNPLPTGLTYEQALAADAAYRAREITKQAVVDSSQGKGLSMDSEPMQAILRRQRAWQLREVQKTPVGRFAGYYDMVMGFIVGHTVVQAFIDAGVKAYRFIATIDDRTTSECRALHGKVFRMEDLKLGVNAPPVYPPPHPCRSVIQAVEVDAPDNAAPRDYRQSGAATAQAKAADVTIHGHTLYSVTDAAIQAVPKPFFQGLSNRMNTRAQAYAREILSSVKELPEGTEATISFSLDGSLVKRAIGTPDDMSVTIQDLKERYIALHNHPSNDILSPEDVAALIRHDNMAALGAVGNKGALFTCEKVFGYNKQKAMGFFQKIADQYPAFRFDLEQRFSFMKIFEEGAEKYGLHFTSVR